ncbi:serine/threonine-protein kinase [Streptomyces spirodelae]|uniref:non-specific serine/threonine protein kinase n=1 Tax=Streptomyces spirodelae TaxID=2812904 RepID=A0ABS3WST4_9ACTN|nr:serine/threonine-protein kinase [Streptomyces spirodelae]MBO8186099.1 protein kinase [Streptomyces spirodelae]
MTGGARGRRGQVIDGRFELLEQLGAGGMGTVWRARDVALHREVALKEVRPPAAGPDDPEAASEGSQALRERVLREARALARLSHPHVVTIHHIVDEGPCPWLVTELVRGPSLEQRLERGPLQPRAAARLGREVLSALRTAHTAGIQHRDVKPANVLLREDGSAVLTDFGIAALQGAAAVTATGEFLGSPEFVAPERVRGIDDDPASDLWSLGLTLYVCTEGHSPLRRATTLATLAAVLDDPVPPPVRSEDLGPVLEAVLVRNPADRPDAAALERMLDDVAEGRAATPYLPTETSMPVRPPFAPPSPPPPGPTSVSGPHSSESPERDAPGKRRSRAAALAVVGVVVAAALATGGAFLLTRPDGKSSGAEEGKRSARPEPAVSDAKKPSTTPSPSRKKGSEPDESEEPTDRPTASSRSGSPTAPASPANTWVAQLGSVAKADGTGARETMRATLSRKADDVRYVDSDRYASLRPGYWMFYSPGPSGGFPDGRAAAAWCGERGLSSSKQCVGRYVSDDAADRGYICAPDRSRGTGRCER